MPLIFRKQTSGGRGEYELVGEAAGVHASDLSGRGFRVETPFGVKETEVILTNQGGKRRFRLTAKVPSFQRQMAALAMLPKNGNQILGSPAQPIVMRGKYLLDIEVALAADDGAMATVKPTVLTARSGPVNDLAHAVNMPFPERMDRVQAVWKRASVLEGSVGIAVRAHQDSVTQGNLVGAPAEKAVLDVMKALIAMDAPFYIPGADPLPSLEFMAGLTNGVDLPLPTEAPKDSPEVRLRLERAYRLARSRGPGAAKFRSSVQRAYDFRCAFCGLRVPKIPGIALAGVDAAHILPWGKFDLDVIQNGLMLCKQHHWAFDNHVLLLRHDSGSYIVDLNPGYASGLTDAATLAQLAGVCGPIPEERLPKASHRPDPSYIEKLYEGFEGP